MSNLEWRIHCSTIRPYFSRGFVLVNKLSDNLSSVKSFQRQSLSSSRYRGVASSSLYIGRATWRNPDNQTRREIFVYRIDPNQPAFNLPKVNQHLNELKLLNRALFDQAGGLPQFGMFLLAGKGESAFRSGQWFWNSNCWIIYARCLSLLRAIDH